MELRYEKICFSFILYNISGIVSMQLWMTFVNVLLAVFWYVVVYTDWYGCGRILFVPFQYPIPFMRFDVTTSRDSDNVDVVARAYSQTRTHACTHCIQTHKQNDRVLLECQNGILVFFARTPQNMCVCGLHANDQCGNS